MPETQDQETEERILDAAHEVFLRRGTAGARMQEIASEAGVNKALLHYYFRSKERLAAAVFRRAMSSFLPSVIRVLGSELSLEEKVSQVVEIELNALSRNRYLPGYILSELTHHPSRVVEMMEAVVGMAAARVRPQVFGVLERQLEEGAARGELRRMSAEQFAVNLLSLCVFPFAARPMLGAILGLRGERFEEFIEERKIELPGFIMRGMRP